MAGRFVCRDHSCPDTRCRSANSSQLVIAMPCLHNDVLKGILESSMFIVQQQGKHRLSLGILLIFLETLEATPPFILLIPVTRPGLPLLLLSTPGVEFWKTVVVDSKR